MFRSSNTLKLYTFIRLHIYTQRLKNENSAFSSGLGICDGKNLTFKDILILYPTFRTFKMLI